MSSNINLEEFFKALKTNVSRKIISNYFNFGLTGIVCIH
jgi:hypothetical protein